MKKSKFQVVGASSSAAQAPPEPAVRLRLAEFLPLIAHAHIYGHAWLDDLAEDPVLVTADLAEVLARFRDLLAEKRA